MGKHQNSHNKNKQRRNRIHVNSVELNTMEYVQQFLNDPEKFILLNFKHKPTIKEISAMLHVSESAISYKLHEYGYMHLTAPELSSMEYEICEFIKHIRPGLTVINNDHEQIKPFELDIYMPELKVAIECNPAWTHHSSVNVFHKNGKLLNKYYHRDKTRMCESKGIRLIHVFGYD